jgi:hemoglobin-like flavoprotein
VAVVKFQERAATVTREERMAVRRSWEIVGAAGDSLSDVFYDRLFAIAPRYRPLVEPDLAARKRGLVALLELVVRSLDRPDEAWRRSVPVEEDLFLVLLALGRRHAQHGAVPDTACDDVAAALLWTLEHRLGKAFTAELRAAWSRVVALVAKTVKMGRCAPAGGASLGRTGANV